MKTIALIGTLVLILATINLGCQKRLSPEQDFDPATAEWMEWTDNDGLLDHLSPEYDGWAELVLDNGSSMIMCSTFDRDDAMLELERFCNCTDLYTAEFSFCHQIDERTLFQNGKAAGGNIIAEEYGGSKLFIYWGYNPHWR